MLKEFTKGIYAENPIFRLILGMCPTLAISTTVMNALGMAAAATFVLICSNILIATIRKITPEQIRIPIFIIIIATFTTMVDLFLAALAPALHQALGIFIPLIVVNCIIFGRAEAYAAKNTVLNSILDALGMGLGFFLGLLLVSSFREILGNGTWLGIPVFGTNYSPALIMILPPGAFLVFGSLIGLMNLLAQKRTGAQICNG
jgi:electron transport complex protein RnfE